MGRVPVITEDLTHVDMVCHHSLVLVGGRVARLIGHQSFSRGGVLLHDSDICFVFVFLLLFFLPFFERPKQEHLSMCGTQ